MRDNQTVMSDDQDVGSGGAATVVCSKSIDLGAPGTDINGGSPPNDAGLADLIVDARVSALAFAGGTSVQAQLVMSANADLSSNTVLESTAAIPTATLVIGYKFALSRIPSGVTKRYIGLQYVVVGAMSAGKIRASLDPMVFP